MIIIIVLSRLLTHLSFFLNICLVSQTIPSLGQTDWYNLEGKGKRQGNLLVKMSFGKEKHKHVSIREYRNLLRVLLNHQINLKKVGDLLLLRW